jgi:hypothetical protein
VSLSGGQHPAGMPRPEDATRPILKVFQRSQHSLGPVDAWYVLTIAAVALAKNLRFYPNIECKCARWEGCREAWRMMGVE